MIPLIRRKDERGAALLLAVFALVLLTGIALAMMFASDTETSISINYRDKQVATYAAHAGLEEARDRIHPLFGDLACPPPVGQSDPNALCWVPQGLPSLTAPNVLYIINPDTSRGESVETIAPWSATIGGQPNPYYDSELCNENTALCSSSGTLPGGNAWYRYYDNSGSAQASGALATYENNWKLAATHGAPVNYKWVRVTLKTDNMVAGVPVLPGTCTSPGVPLASCVTSGKQVCWNDAREQQIPAGYTTACTPIGAGTGRPVSSITITGQGSGYSAPPTTPPAVRFSGGGGSGAAATAQVTEVGGGGVTSVTLTDFGRGYVTPPMVTVVSTDGTGSGAQVTATLDGQPVSSVSVNSSGTPECFQPPITLNAVFDASAGSGAAGSVQMTGNRCIYSFTSSGSCSKNTTYTISAADGSGSGFSGTVTYGNNKNSGTPAVTNPGSYSTVPTQFNTGGCTITIVPNYGVQVQGVTMTSGGSYTSAPNVTFTGGSPAPGSGTTSGVGNLAGTSHGAVAALNIVSPGSGYSSPPILVFTAPASVGSRIAAATASVDSTYKVTSITLTDGGGGYTSSPTVTIDPPGVGGMQATAIANLGSAPPGTSGQYMTPVYMLTAMAQTRSGSRAMMQMEATPVRSSFGLAGALTLVGPNPSYGTPNSMGFVMNGNDCPTCGSPPPSCNTEPYRPLPAIGVADPTGASNPSAVETVISALGKPNNYIGADAAPDVKTASYSYTMAMLNDLVTLADGLAHQNNTYVDGNATSDTVPLGTQTNPVVDFVTGNFTMGPHTGYGVLVVQGQLTFSGDYSWNGLILVVGDGASIMNGGGNGQIVGSVFVANTAGGTLNPVNVDWSGGGGNGIQYNHCLADDLLGMLGYQPPLNYQPLQVISQRPLPN